MNTDVFSETLLELYRLARLVPMPHFQHGALEALSSRIDFDSAWWGIASRPAGGELEIHSSLSFGMPAEYPSLWEEIKADDALADAVTRHPGSTVRFGARQLHSTPGLSALMAQFGVISSLCTITLLPELNLWVYLTLRRHRGKPAFTQHERRAKQRLMPHLTAALSANWMQYLERVRATAASPHGALAVVDKRGLLYVADQSLTRVMRREWPHWSGPVLPPELVRCLHDGAPYEGRSLRLRLHPVGEVWLVELSADSPAGRLSPRETQVAMRFSEGASYKEIARSLDMAPATARHHLRVVYRKLEVSDKGALAQKLMQHRAPELGLHGVPSVDELPGAAGNFGRPSPR